MESLVYVTFLVMNVKNILIFHICLLRNQHILSSDNYFKQQNNLLICNFFSKHSQ